MQNGRIIWQLLEMHPPEPGISWKSTCQDTSLRKPQKFQENSERNISGNKSQSQKGTKRQATGGQGRPPATGPPRAVGGARPWSLWPLFASPSAYY